MFAIGSILRMIEEQGGRRPLPRITNTSHGQAPVDASLTPRRAAYIVICSVLLLLLGVAHLSLRFAMRDLKLQHVSLQAEQRDLLQQLVALEMENEAMCSPEELKQFAIRQLGMVDYTAATHERAQLPPEAKFRYLDANAMASAGGGAREGGGVLTLPAPRDTDEGAIGRVAEMLGSVNRAVAGQRDR